MRHRSLLHSLTRLHPDHLLPFVVGVCLALVFFVQGAILLRHGGHFPSAGNRDPAPTAWVLQVLPARVISEQTGIAYGVQDLDEKGLLGELDQPTPSRVVLLIRPGATALAQRVKHLLVKEGVEIEFRMTGEHDRSPTRNSFSSREGR